MDTQSIVAALRQELARIDAAIAALSGTDFVARRGPGRPAGSGPKQRRMSAAARARIGTAKKAWWAKQKGTGKRTKTTHKKTTSKRKPMSPAMRKKLSAMMKARWAARKKAA